MILWNNAPQIIIDPAGHFYTCNNNDIQTMVGHTEKMVKTYANSQDHIIV